MEGLRKGQNYTLAFQQNRFPAPQVTVIHSSRNRSISIGSYGTYTFRGDGSTETLTIQVKGVR